MGNNQKEELYPRELKRRLLKLPSVDVSCLKIRNHSRGGKGNRLTSAAARVRELRGPVLKKQTI